MSKLFITGATGYIGSAVAEYFQKKGYEVYALARNPQSAKAIQEKNLNPILGDITNSESYKERLKEFDLVIHTASTNDSNAPKADEEVVRVVTEQLRDTNKTFIYTSGTWVFGNTEKTANEQTPLSPIPLVAWRVDVEKKVVEAAKQGFRTIVIRPGIVYGRDGGIVGDLFERATQGEVPYATTTNRDNHWALVHVEDLAELYFLANEKAKSGSLYNATQGEPVRQNEVAELIAQTAGVTGKSKSYAVEDARKFFGPYADGLALDQRIDSSAAQRDLGWSPKAPTIQAEIRNRKVLANTKA